MVVMNSIIQKSTFIFYASNSTYLKYQYTYLSALCLLKKIKHVTSNSHIHQHENSSTITVAYRWRKEHVESNYWTQLICGHRRLSLVSYMIMHKNDLLVTLLWNNDDPKVKLRTYCIVLRIETKKRSARTVAQSKWFEWNRVPTRSPSPVDGRKVTGQESGNGPLFFQVPGKYRESLRVLRETQLRTW